MSAHGILRQNIIANLLGQLTLLLLSLLTVKLVYHQLGPDALGIVFFVQTLNIILTGVLDLGVSSVTVREVAAHFSEDANYVIAVLRTASSVYWTGFLSLAILTLLGAPLVVGHWLRLGSLNPETATLVIRLLGIAALTSLPRALYISIFRGLQRSSVNNTVDVCAGLLQQLGAVAVLARGGGLLAVAAWLAAGYLLVLVAYAVTLSRFVPIRALVPGWSSRAFRRNAEFSKHMMSISALSAIHTYFDKLVISRLLPIASLGSYTSASSLVARGTLLTSAIAEAAYPSLSALHHRRDEAGLLHQYRRLQDLVCYATLPLYAGLIYLMPPLLSGLFGAAVSQALLLPVAALCLGYYLNGTLTVPYVFSLAVGKPGITSRLSLEALLVVVPVTIASVALLGVAGAGLGYLSYHIYAYLVGIPRYCRDCLPVSSKSFYRHIGVGLGLGAAVYGAGFLFAAGAGGLSAAALGAAFALASLLYLAGVWRMAGNDFEPFLRQVVPGTRVEPPSRAA